MCNTQPTAQTEGVFRQELLPTILHFRELSDTTQHLIEKTWAKLDGEECDQEDEVDDEEEKRHEISDEDDNGSDDDGSDDDLVTASILYALDSPNITERDRILLKDSLHSRLKENHSAEPVEADFNIAAYDIPKNDDEECIQLTIEVDANVLDALRSSIYNDYCEWKHEQINSTLSVEEICVRFVDYYRSLQKSVGGKAPRQDRVGQSHTEPKALLPAEPINMSPPTRVSRIRDAIALSATGRPHGRIQLEDFTVSNHSDQENNLCLTVTIMVCEQDIDHLRFTMSEEDLQSELRTPAERSRNEAAGERLYKKYISLQVPVQDAPLPLQEDSDGSRDGKPAEDTVNWKRKRALSPVEEGPVKRVGIFC
ncbi:uncharacterized protein HMPREF1541_10423 [Cyphellophora europaea CBS 101466]|uniref:Uncharacterized protein n=1 Tax=Cyphellophora europaea (strain CBS 101466) TaxID=1220924 RepID=W2S9N8_CYPE1|nr:uncharacterized protein HMPREF1541_10423 [Cyphellophora europaea CBS 101466]ETN44753.1 hypothetical protein HMPREF1541_10423 [Cyphellophora europaea CBS 101466]